MSKNFSSFEDLNILFTRIGNILRGKPNVAEMTKEAYEALTPTQKNDNTIRFLTNDMTGTRTCQVYELPTADASLINLIYQYVGATNANYTNGLFYQCQEISTGVYGWVHKPMDNITVTSSGTASSTNVSKQTITVNGTATDIEGTVYMEQSVTLDASDPTIATFTNAAITAASKIEVFVSTWNLVPENVSCAAGTCAVTLPADEDESTITVGIYVR